MEFFPQSIKDIILIKPKIHWDNRGYFLERFRDDLLTKNIDRNIRFCQDNESKSYQGVLRGLHFQIPPFAQSKLVHVTHGEVLDITVDIRKGSPTFGKHVSVVLSSENNYQLFIPKGFAHGFLVLSNEAIFHYKTDNYYSPKHAFGLAFNDPTLEIDWKIDKKLLKISTNDLKNPTLNKLKHNFYYNPKNHD